MAGCNYGERTAENGKGFEVSLPGKARSDAECGDQKKRAIKGERRGIMEGVLAKQRRRSGYGGGFSRRRLTMPLQVAVFTD